MIYLDEAAINERISVSDVIRVIEQHYLQDQPSDFYVPERMFINDRDNTALLMPSFYKDYYGAKLIGIAPGNASIGEPTLRGVFLLNNRHTMKSLGLFDAGTITAMRTGAASGLSMKYLAKKQAKTVGIIGTGDQGWSHLQAACAVRPIETVYVFNRSPERQAVFIQKAESRFPDLEILPAQVDELVERSDIIVMTTTSIDPVIPPLPYEDMVGKHIAASGAFKSFMQEIPNVMIEHADQLVVDSFAAFEECGEMAHARAIGREQEVITLQQLVQRGEDANPHNRLTIYKSVGKAIYDILTAKLIYEKSFQNKG